MNEPPPLPESRWCSRCGATIQPAANFCNACGAAVPKSSTPQGLTDKPSQVRPKNRPLLATLIALIFIGITLYAINTGLYEQRQQASKATPSPAPTASPKATATATPSPTTAVATIPKAVSLDQVIDNAKIKMTPPSTSDELKDAKEELLKIRPSSRRYSEVQQMLRQIDQYIDAAAKAERRAAFNWRYSEPSDEMGRGVEKSAEVSSENEIEFGSPYEGAQRATLRLQNSPNPKFGKKVALYIEKGQFSCGYPTCDLSIRFDDGKIQTFKAEEGAPSNRREALLFMDYDYNRLISLLRKSNRVQIEAHFYREGPRYLVFNVAGLDW